MASERMTAALKRAPCTPSVQLNETQGESIGLIPDGTGFVTVSEKANGPAPQFRLHTRAL
jgi:hypothetical protein